MTRIFSQNTNLKQYLHGEDVPRHLEPRGAAGMSPKLPEIPSQRGLENMPFSQSRSEAQQTSNRYSSFATSHKRVYLHSAIDATRVTPKHSIPADAKENLFFLRPRTSLIGGVMFPITRGPGLPFIQHNRQRESRGTSRPTGICFKTTFAQIHRTVTA